MPTLSDRGSKPRGFRTAFLGGGSKKDGNFHLHAGSTAVDGSLPEMLICSDTSFPNFLNLRLRNGQMVFVFFQTLTIVLFDCSWPAAN